MTENFEDMYQKFFHRLKLKMIKLFDVIKNLILGEEIHSNYNLPKIYHIITAIILFSLSFGINIFIFIYEKGLFELLFFALTIGVILAWLYAIPAVAVALLYFFSTVFPIVLAILLMSHYRFEKMIKNIRWSIRFTVFVIFMISMFSNATIIIFGVFME